MTLHRLVFVALGLVTAATLARAGASRTLTTTLHDGKGHEVGEATPRETPNGVLVQVSLHDLPASEHGFHVHETGVCEPPFASAGGHLAKAGSAHGFLVAKGPHEGDLPNLVVPSGGSVTAELFAEDLRIGVLEDADGAALIVHAKADDYRSQPSGAAGDRIACGVLAPAGG